jgi:hypothetical protein
LAHKLLSGLSPDVASCSTTSSPSQGSGFKAKVLNRRKRKSAAQVEILKEEYNRNPHWTKLKIAALSYDTGLSEAQVYKWSWDYRKKLCFQQRAVIGESLKCAEIIAPSELDLAMYRVQRAYRQSMMLATQGV